MRARKLFIGRRLRDIRESRKLTQAMFAQQLGLSTSYLNQLENNHRHASAPVLLALAERFSVDIATLSDSEADRLMADMAEALADPLFSSQPPSHQDLELVARNAPAMARAFLLAHHGLRRVSDELVALDHSLEHSGSAAEPTAWEEVRDYFHDIDNYVHSLDVAAEHFADELAATDRSLDQALRQRLSQQHGVTVIDTADGATLPLRHFDASARTLALNPASAASTRTFQLAHQIALLEHASTLDELVEQAEFRSADAGAVARVGFANAFAGATLLPYSRFASQAQTLRHDLERLADLFDASIEQVAHRLSTLQRPGANGIPFFFARVDQAGNITKRHSATRLRFARFGSACPLWNVHRAFETTDTVIRQLAETPDGARYLCLATAVNKRSGGYGDPVQRYALSLGCEIRHAGDVVYADDLDQHSDVAFEPIGVSCRICERSECHQRAMPPMRRALHIEADSRGAIPYKLT
jgi:predicted transcriptional regulator/DNA-binding XRE family transcriptional regulator